MIKLIATDIDGTLVKDDKTISQHTIDTLKKARSKGIFVVLCSGRPLSGVKPYLDKLGINSDSDFVIVNNGAQIKKVQSKESIIENTLSRKDIEDIAYATKKVDIFGQIVTADSKLYVSNPDITRYSISDAYHTKMDYYYRKLEDTPNKTFTKYMWADDPYKIDIAFAKFPQKLKERFYSVRSDKCFLEFMHPDANKGQAVLSLAKFLNIKPSEIMTVGDEMNDYTMIDLNVLGVAMGNANPKIKDVSKYITKTNNDDGLAKAVEKFAL